MGQIVNLDKEVYNRTQYEQVIDTSFSQLVPPSSSIPIEALPTVDEFFQDYDSLFFQIPQSGENSHETLIVSSTDYIGYQPLNDEIQALTEEITSLRTQLLESRQQLADLANGGSN
tara:strand:- start:1501 stop:1848 length:348 start_codon:yes stop_codon:yes gene_type:complete